MEVISHRELRNRSAEVLRRVEAGESLQVSNHGRVIAQIAPAGGDRIAELVASGGARPARAEIAVLRLLRAKRADAGSAEIIEDVRGRW